MPVLIRAAVPIRPVDTAALAWLRRLWTEEQAGAQIDDPGFDRRLADWFAVEAGHRRTWLATDEGTPVGMVSLVLMRRMPRPGRPDSTWGYVHQLFVVAERRGEGIGGVLLDTVVADATADGLSQLVLHPTEDSRAFYERHEFVPAAHLLHRDLAPPS